MCWLIRNQEPIVSIAIIPAEVIETPNPAIPICGSLVNRSSMNMALLKPTNTPISRDGSRGLIGGVAMHSD
ncbi:hypothetical protein AYI68_g373 [Smittium mucronatum]|uniref:Uncharacterized protein n=1 Tax=Smittium mucronatum TaxID=133383 RepID=A0A1R0H8C7_9FUNG|nr:hypothetical protein AYI68_g373 [Smittium mucronatum]